MPDDPEKPSYPQLHFGEVGAKVDWRAAADDEPDDDDDELAAVTDPFIIAALGFDPLDLTEEEASGGAEGTGDPAAE